MALVTVILVTSNSHINCNDDNGVHSYTSFEDLDYSRQAEQVSDPGAAPQPGLLQ